MKKVIQGGTLVNEHKQFKADLVIDGDRIAAILPEAPTEGCEIIHAEGCYVLPGVIDDQVHFREPGLTHKGNIAEGSRAAAAGGVTSFMDMPNVLPPTTTRALLEEKQNIAARNSVVNYSFYLGATKDNIDEIRRVDTRTTCGIKVFMGASTGNLLVDDLQALERIFAESPLLIATHCEDTPTINRNLALYKEKYGDDIPPACHPLIRNREACLKSSSLAVSLARKYGSRLHLLHEGDLSAGGEARGHAGGVLLGDAHVQVLLRQGLAEGAGLAGLADVHVHHKDAGVLPAQLHDLVAEPVTGGFFHSFAHLQSLLQHFTYCSSSSAMAWLYSSSLGATPCQPHWFSM